MEESRKALDNCQKNLGIAIGHLETVIDERRVEQAASDKKRARTWLDSIGSHQDDDRPHLRDQE
jgi:hypothetical protein